MKEKRLESIVEGILFAMGGSVAPEKMALAMECTKEDIVAAIENLRKEYDENDSGISIIEIEGAYQMCTSPDIYDYLIKIAKQPQKHVLTDVMLEVLSIIAYKQPVTRSEIDKIRGVSSDSSVSKLVEYGLVEEIGRLDAPGRPMLFGTTEDFLRSFGVNSIEDLPTLDPAQIEEFKAEAEAEAFSDTVEQLVESDTIIDI